MTVPTNLSGLETLTGVHASSWPPNSREDDSKSFTLVTSATVGSTEKVTIIEMRPGMVA